MRKNLLLLLAVSLLSVAGTCQTTHSASLTWAGSSTAGATYNVLRGSTPGGAKTAVASGLSALSFTDAGLPANTAFCYQVTASVAGLADSTPSNEVCGATGKDQASPPSVLVVVFK